MDKNAIKKFAVWARDELIAKVCIKAKLYGVDKGETYDINADTVNGRALSPQEKTQRQALIKQINSKGYDNVIEEIAYIWFNRFCALRYMEVNGYLPSRVRVFTDDEGNFNPQILSEALDLDIEGLDINKIYEYKKSNNDEELYKYLLTVQCNALGEILPGMFHKISDYAELLLPDKLLNEGSIIDRLVKDIPEEDWKDQVQIIGWLYQYYNTEPKDVVFTNLKKNVKISKENIAPATQLFTPDWIVRYMVENSLGRLWLEGHENEELKSGWKYYLDEAEQTEEVRNQLEEIRREKGDTKPEDIKCIDPCMGSGHILCYMFDILMQIYESYGYTSREAVESIVTKNLYGLDIDERASQLAYFAVMMKARQYDKRFFIRHIQPNVYDFQNLYLNPDDFESHEIRKMITVFNDADEYGSLLDVKDIDIKAVSVEVDNLKEDLFNLKSKETLVRMVKITEILQQKYDVVCTNPPYMGGSGMNSKLSDFVKKNYPDSKSDLFAVFIEKCGEFAKSNGFYSMITQHAWMFLSSYEKLRQKLALKTTVNMAHLGARAFDEIGGEVVQTTAFVNYNSHIKDYKGTYVRLVDIVGENEKKEQFLSGENRYTATQENFSKIPGSPVAYWVSENFVRAFEKGERLGEICETRLGFATGDNDRFLRYWYEVSNTNTGFNIKNREESVLSNNKWFPINKGGSFRRWYGNNEYVVNWENDGYEIRNFRDDNNKLRSRPQNLDKCFSEGISWTVISSYKCSFRMSFTGFCYNNKGPCITAKDISIFLILGYSNSKVTDYILEITAPTIGFESGYISDIPIILNESNNSTIEKTTIENISLSKTDWDSFETSWDFKKHPLVEKSKDLWDATAVGAAMSAYYGKHIEVSCPLELCYMLWQGECNERFNRLKANEEELNRIFIDIYGLQDELTPEVEDKDVTVRKADLQREIKSLISYAAGCMFGRYSLDVEGLAYAGGEWDDSKYKTFIPDKDGIIPICDDEYFEDDIVNRFCDFVKTVYGEETLEENLRFIADALGGKGSSREVIRSYFMNDFYKDHCKVYQKRPIYWLFDSGKKNGFKCLIYMHRYKTDTIMRIRTDYVHELQSRYRTAIEDLQKSIEKATATERVKLTKQLTKLKDQSDEIRTYEEKIHHLADMQISIDLDDGVKHNYELFGDVLGKIK